MNKNVWAVGDLQGCCKALDALLEQPEIKDDPNCELWFAGDLTNRGPESLRTLRRLIELGDRAVCILGNHDLHLLAVYAGIRRQNKSDTIDDILNAKDARNLINWLRHRPLAHYDYGHLMVHAGVMAKWDLATTLRLANEAAESLRSRDWKKNLQNMYGNEPSQWKESLEGSKRLRVIINALTRIRLCTSKGHMDFASKEAPGSDKGLIPWFEVPGRKTVDDTIIFGHWSTLGLLLREHLIALDTGCVWGGKLTAIRLNDRKLIQIAAVNYTPQS